MTFSRLFSNPVGKSENLFFKGVDKILKSTSQNQQSQGQNRGQQQTAHCRQY